MSSDRVDWVEIIEPKTKEHMYANLTTGECVWDPPEGVNVKRTDSSQWWELFDNNTHRFYYYNATTQTTVWHRPVDCDIIPLAKLQTLKQNTDPQQRREISTQTNSSQPGPQVTNKSEGVSNGIGSGSKSGLTNSKNATHTQTSPLQTKRSHHHRCSGEGRRCRGTAASGSGPGGAMCRHTDSGRSSDSSISSAAQPYRRLQEAGLAIPVPLHKPPDSRVGSETGSMSRGAGGVPASSSTPQLKKKNPASPHSHHHHQTQDVPPDKWPLHSTGLNRSGSFMSPRKDASDDSMHEKYFKSVESTPLTRRKVKQNCATVDSSSETSPQSPESPQAQSQTPVQQPQSQTQSVRPSPLLHQLPSTTHPQVPARPSLVSSISLATDHPSHNPHSHIHSHPHPTHQQSLDRIGHRHRDRDRDRTSHQYHLERGARERFSDRHIDKDRVDERLLERNLERTYPSDKQALYNVDKGFRQTSLDYRHTPASQSSTPQSKTQSISPASINWHPPKDMTRKQQAEPEKPTKQNSTTKQSCSTPDSHSSKSSYHHQESHSTSGAGFAMKSLALEPYLTKPNIERHNMEIERERERNRDRTSNDNGESDKRQKGPRKQKVASAMDTLESGSGCENGNTSPLYSNWDLDMQHLLPLQHYILEQAKLSACYRTGEGDPLSGEGLGSGDSDSLRSSGSGSGSSARSLSGHEPDNEDSDRSGSNDGYLQHHPPPATITHHTTHHRDDEYMNHGVSYYNTFIGFEKDSHPTGVLRSASGTGIGFTPNSLPAPGMPVAVCEALYSPVKSHPALHHTSKETDIEKFAQDNLNLHSKGIFRKKASVRDMLSWTSSGISGPMLGARRDKAHKKAAAEIFRLVQIYMGDRKARPGMTLNSVAIDVLQAAYTNPALRDELYVQLCRQTTENPQRDSLLRGWELLAVSLAFVPPSPAFQPPLLNYMNRHRDPAFADTFPEVGKWPIHVQVSHYAGVACRRLERIGQCGKKQPRKPNTEDIDQARIQIFRSSMFGNTLGEVMILQKDRFPNRQLPWIQVALSQQVLALQGKQTEGIFRVSADVDEVNTLKSRLDNWELPDHFQITDAHAPASLLKLWYRELYEPLIPDTLYAECVADPDNTQNAIDIVQRLPRLNRIVLTYLVGFLQQFSTPEVVIQTKMDSANLAMVFAPNCLRCTSQDPRVILDNARKEMTFMKCLILNMDTQQVRDMLGEVPHSEWVGLKIKLVTIWDVTEPEFGNDCQFHQPCFPDALIVISAGSMHVK